MRQKKPTGIKPSSILEMKRNSEKQTPKKIIYIICEGDTEVIYFKNLRKQLRAATIEVIRSKGSAPISVVEHAIDIIKTETGVDEIWCVLDRDQHPTFEKAKAKWQQYVPSDTDKSQAARFMVVSNPSFELWYMLHFSFTTKSYMYYTNKTAAMQVESDLKKKLAANGVKDGKPWRNVFSILYPLTKAATKNADSLLTHNRSANTDNPETNVHELVRSIGHDYGERW